MIRNKSRNTQLEGSVILNGSINSAVDENELKHSNIRRTKSVTLVEQLTAGERKVRRSQPDKPCHQTGDSLFSWASGFDRFEGFINWGCLLLFLGGSRLFLENVNKYGIRISPTNVASWVISENKNNSYIHTPLFLILSNIHIITIYMMEKSMSKGSLRVSLGLKLHIVHLGIIILTPVVLLRFWSFAFSLLGRTLICIVYTVYFIKFWSYVQVNHWCRCDRERIQKFSRKRCHSFKNLLNAESSSSSSGNYNPVQYPNNLTLGDLYYFLAAPTLCYELNFPRSHTIRVRFLIRRVLEIFILSNILIGLFQQWIIPTVKNSLKPFSELDYLKCTERILKLAIPNHLLWLIAFYMIFHSTLNTVGEVLRFGDRNFYQDWWNSKNLASFWRLWNLPVHKWCVRHVFLPLIKSGWSKTGGEVIVFLLSAFLHEYLVSIPLGMYKVEVFLGMLIQVPIIYISEVVERRLGFRAGNIIVWASLILGQPIAIMIYVHDYVIQNYSLDFVL